VIASAIVRNVIFCRIARKKRYDVLSKYDRRKLREELARNYARRTPEEIQQRDIIGCFIIIFIALLIGALIYLVAGPGPVARWFNK
jgi:hypothetical protein